MTKKLLQKSITALAVLLFLFKMSANAQQNTNLINAQLASEREKYGLTADDVSDYLITDHYTDRETGLTHAYIQQRHNKVIVYNAVSVFLIKDNKVLYFKPGMIDHLAQKVKTASPNITPEAAIGYALMNIGRNEIAPVKLISTDNNLNTLTYESPAISASPIKVQLVYRVMDDGIYLAWDVSIELKDEPHWWNVRIDALTGNYLDKNDWTVNCSFDDPNHICAMHVNESAAPVAPLSPLPPPPPLGEYNVYPFPVEAPSFGSRTNLINPEDLTASPFGWHDDNGIAGNEYTITRGNNVHAYEDANNDNLPGYSPNSATLQFNYPVDLTQAPLVNQDASITNLFYLNNRIHDVLYYAGFTAAAGNFQQNNYGMGGLGNDYVQAEAFDGSGTNNANFGTPADGSRPRMQMYLWTAPNPDRDGSFDNGIVAHEYGHGVSNRLTGGPAQAGCLGNAEQGGEGWSDWLALIMTIEPGDTVAGGMLTQARGIGTYALNQATNGAGIRRFRYSVNMAINPQTYADLATSGTGPHNKGEIWCDAIWDMTCFLVNDLGFNSDPSVTTAGNNIAMRLVLEGMKLQPCSPGYLDARDAILNADAVLYNNAHRCRIWEAFARRGMGFSALQGSANSSTDQTAAFNMPPFCLMATLPPVAGFTSNVTSVACAGSVQFTDTSTQAHSWLWDFGDGSTSILANPSHQFNSPGTYNVKLVVTNPLGSDSVTHPITVTSTFSANVTAAPNPVSCGSSVQLNAVGSGSSNITYTLSSIPFAPVSGTPIAGPSGDDIVSSFIPIGFNFPFYNTNQTQLKISTNGFITFNASSGSGCCAGATLPNNSNTLSNLVAVCWTDLNVGGPGTIDYFNLTGPNRFVIRWNNVAHCCGTTPAQVTAQIILYETGEIEIHNTSIVSSVDLMTQGIENASGTNATVVPGRNAASFSASNDAYRFTPIVNYSYNWLPGNLNGASQTVNPVANTTYTVNVADGSGCVEAFTSPLITVNPFNVVIGGSSTFCPGGSTTLDAGSYSTYNWSTGATTQTITVNTAGTFTVSVTNAAGCSGSGSITTIVTTALTPVIFGDFSICNGYTNILDAGIGYATYSWSTGATTQTIPVSTAGTFTVTVSDGAGCTGTASAATIIDVIPSPTISGNLIYCPGSSSVLSTGLFAGYSWSTGATTQSIAINTTGTFTVNVTNAEGCTASASVTTTNFSPPAPVITGTTSFCTGSSSVLDAGVYSSYFWSTGATTQTITVNSALIFTVTVTDANGCTASTSASVTLYPLPNPSISGASTICDGTTNILDAGVFSGYNWSTGATTQTAAINLPGTYTVTVTDGNGCTKSATKTVVSLLAVNPVITQNPNTVVCPGSNVTLTLDSTVVFSQQSPISIPTTVGNATPYPSSIVVSGFPTSGVTVKKVTLNGVSHTFPDDLDILLQSPTGTNVILMSDVGGGTDIVSQTFVFQDGSPALSNNGPITGGTYSPTNIGSPDTWSAPGPGSFTQAAPAISMFTGNMNGVWNLLVTDGFNQDGGTINSWSITFEASNSNITYAWSPATGLSNTTQIITTASPAVTTTYTVTINDGISGCTATLSSTVNIHVAPVADAPANVTVCDSYTLPALTVGNYFSGSGGTGTFYSAGNTITSSMTMYVYAETGTTPNCTDENSFTITINTTPNADAPANVTACDSYTLPALTVGNYFSGSGGTGTFYSAGNTITSSMTMYVYAETGTTPNCTDENSFTITINTTPNADAPANVTACDSYTLPALTVGNYFSGSGGTGTAYSAGNTITSSMTMYVYAETGTIPNCTDENSFTVTINPLPTPSISGTLAFCAGGSTTLDAGAYASYNWSTGETTQNISVNTAGTFTVTVTDVNGCTGSTSVTTIVNANPTPSISGNLAFCAGGSSTLDAGAGYSSYNWSTGATTQTILVTTTGTFAVIVTDPNGCTGSASATTTVGSLNPSISGTLAICASGSTTLDAGAGYNSYNWSSGETTQNITVNTAGTFTVTVSDLLGCTGTASVATIVNPNPTPSISGTLIFCDGSSSTLDAGSGYNNYNWSTGATTQTISVNTAGTFVVTVTDANGCTGSVSVTTVVNTSPAPVISGNITFCSGSSTTLDAGSGYSGYSWSTGATTQNISVNTAGAYIVTVSDANGCTGSASVTTTVNPNPNTSVSGALAFCAGSSTTLDAGAYSGYSWSTGETTQAISVNTAGTFTVTVTDGNGCSGSTSVTTTVNPNPTPSISGTLAFCDESSTTLDAGFGYSDYSWSTGETKQTISVNTAGTFEVTVTDANGCAGSASVTTTVNPNPTPTISGTLAFCSGSSSTLDAGAGYSNYNWSTGAATQSISVNTAGIFTVTVTDANGCVGETDVTTTVNTSPTPSISGTLVFCAGSSSTLDAGDGYSAYSWSTGATTQYISVNTTGVYTVTVTDANGCTGSATANVVVNPLPVVTISGPSSFCNAGFANLNATPGYSSYLWSNGETNSSIITNFATTYTVTVTDANGCTASASKTITMSATVPQQPGVINGPGAVCLNSSASFSIAAMPGVTSYTWAAGPGATVTLGQGTTNVTISFNGFATSSNVTVYATNACGNGAVRTKAYLVSSVIPAKPATINGQQYGLCNMTGVVYNCPLVANATSYFWTVPAGVTILSGQGTNAIIVKFTGSFLTAGQITVIAQSGCGNSAARSRTIYAKPQQPVISGQNWACKGQAALVYSVAPVPGATSYTWTPVPGSTIVSGQGTTTIVYNWGGINGVIKCKANSACGSSLPASFAVSFTCKEDGSLFEISDLNLYPNPASTSATLQFDGFADGKAQLSVYDLIGQQLLNKNLDVTTGNNQYVIDLSTLPKGMYNLQVIYNGLTRNSKLVVQ